jgi:hypothetical protein
LRSGPGRKPTGPFAVINPRKIPKGRFIIREGDKRWFEGDAYDGPKAEHWLRRGFIKRGK